MYYIITEEELASLLGAAQSQGHQEAIEEFAEHLVGPVQVSEEAVRRDDTLMETILSRTHAAQAAISQVVLAAGSALLEKPVVSPLDCMAAADLLIEVGILLDPETHEDWGAVIDAYGTPAE